MALVLRGGHGWILVYKHILVCFFGPLVSNFLAEKVKCAIAALHPGMFNVCFLPHTIFHMMLMFLTSVLSKPTGLGWLWGSAFSMLCLALLKVPINVYHWYDYEEPSRSCTPHFPWTTGELLVSTVFDHYMSGLDFTRWPGGNPAGHWAHDI